ncbi:MAG: Type 1 glutamine amidotransferase-like domain-containing protein [Actinomycetota bacterium]
MSDAHIVAMGGGQWPDDPIYRFIFELTGAGRPKVLSVPTATGDNDRSVAAFFRAFPARRWEPAVLSLFDRTVQDLRSLVLSHDVVLVGGGNTLNMLAVWRAHGLDVILREAWETGVLLAGGSAGANCWFEASTTDSYLLGRADPLHDGLGLVPGSFCPHFDSEPARRPSYVRLVGEGALPPGIACDDLAAVHLVGEEVATVLVSDPTAGARRVTPGAQGDVVETPFEVTLLAGAPA